MPLWMWLFLILGVVWFGIRLSEARKGKQTVGIAVVLRTESPAFFWFVLVVHASCFLFAFSALAAVTLKALGAF